MKLLVEKWVKGIDEISGGEIETIAETIEVANEDEAKTKAEELKLEPDTVRVTLHYCYNDEIPPKPCKRVEI